MNIGRPIFSFYLKRPHQSYFGVVASLRHGTETLRLILTVL